MERHLGGESSGRSFLGGKRNRPRAVGLAVVAVAGGVATLVWQTPALAVALVAAAVVWLATTGTHAGSPLQRWQARSRWRTRTKLGLSVFLPVSDRPAGLQEELAGARRRDRKRLRTQWNAYRDWPDGVEGLNWLQAKPGLAGVLWHTPTGEEPYLSVVFPVSGQIRGLEGDAAVVNASHRFGLMLASWGNAQSLASRAQMLTRVMPLDSARHERWVMDNVDPDAPEALLNSYDEVVRDLSQGAPSQRHHIVVRWPLDGRFLAAAGRRGPGEVGWRALMAQEIDGAWRRIAAARFDPGPALTAAKVAALLRHLQLPSWPMDQAGDVSVTWPWLPSEDSWSATRVYGVGPDGAPVQWFHRTGRVPIEAVGTGPRGPTWMLPILSYLPDRVVRSVSTELEMIPAREARAQARSDLTSDLADLHSQERKGALTNEELEVSMVGARARRDDLAPGSGVAGAGWAMHVSLSARTLEELADACAVVEEAFAGDMDIDRLEWMDTYQAGAQAACWPVARGMAPISATQGQKLRRVLAGRGTKEAMS